jgi:hypothetical protein
MAKTTRIAFYLGRRAENPKALLGDWLVCAVTRSRYSHIELLARHSTESVMVDGKVYIGPVAWMLSASIRENAVREAWRTLDTSRWVVVEFEGDSAPALAYIRARIAAGIKYGWFDLLSFLLPWRVSWSKTDFCSEVIAAAFGLPAPWKKSPQHLYDWAMQQPGARVLSADDLTLTWSA